MHLGIKGETKPKMATNNGKTPMLQHSINPKCTSAPAIGDFDKRCPKCKQIWRVVLLRRKSVALGASEQEQEAAYAVADSIIDKYGLRRGEVFDRLYPPPTKEQFAEPGTSHGQKIVSVGGNEAWYGYRKRNRADLSF